MKRLADFWLIFFGLTFHGILFAQTGSINGFVYDAANGEALIGANVYLEGTQIGSSTNTNGYYVIPKVPVGKYTLTAHYLGYEPFKKELTLSVGDQLNIKINLKEKEIQLEGVVVTGEAVPEAEKLFEQELSKLKLSARQIKSIPQVAESDLLRALQTLPGILPISDFSSALYVRGGTPDQNLNMLDGTDVYNPEHAFGLFSTFNTDAIKQVELSKGGFSAKYGGRLSSILNVTNLDGNREQFEGTASISMLSAKTTLQMPIGSVGSISGSIRRTYFDKTIAKAIDNVPDYYFYDGNIKAYFDLGAKNKLTLSSYTSEDELKVTFNEDAEDEAGFNYDWGNMTGSIRWTTVMTPQLFGNFWITGSRFDSDFDFGKEFDFTEVNFVSDITFKGDLEYHYSKSLISNFGFEQKNLHLIFRETFPDGKINIDVRPKHYTAYINNNWQPNYRWDIELGLRYNFFDADENFRDWDPRFSAKYRLTDTINLKAATGIYHQYLHQIPRAFIAGIWSASNKYQKGSSARHFIMGISKDFNDNFQIEVETYYKDYSNIYSFNQNVGVEIQPDRFENGAPVYETTRGVFNRGKGNSKGVEFLLRKESGAMTGWVGYSLSFTKYTIDGINQENAFSPRHDRTHALNLVANIDWKNFKRSLRGEKAIQHKSNWTFGITFVYTSGQPITLPGSGYFFNKLPDQDSLDYEVFPSIINDLRLPPYMRLDFSITYEKNFKHWSILPYIQIFNIGNRKNVWFVQYDQKDYQPDIDTQHMFPILPTIGINFKF